MRATPPEMLHAEQSQVSLISLDKIKPISAVQSNKSRGWAWATVFGAFLAQFSGIGLTTSFGVYQDFYTRVYLTECTPSSIAWIGSVNGFLIFVLGLLTGRLHDRGYFHFLTITGAILCSVSLFLLSLAKPGSFYQIFITQGLGHGLGAGLMYVPSYAILSHHFEGRQRTFAMTMAASGAAFGATIHPILLNNTINGPLGFANGTRLLATIVTALLALSCYLMRPTIAPAPAPVNYVTSLKKFSRDKAYILIVLGAFFFCLAWHFPLFFLQVDAISHGISKSLAFYILVILGGAGFVGRLITSLLAQKFEAIHMVILSTACCGSIIFAMIGASGYPVTVTIAALYGFFSGMYISLQAPTFTLLADNVDEVGLRMGVGLTFSAFGSLIGAPIHGAALGEPYVWWRPAVFSGVACCLSSILFLSTLIILRKR